MMRSTVEAAVVVCSVPNTRWPVSAVSIAIAMVSRSRISPTSTMSGSSRSADRSARLKLSVCTPTCRWVMTHFLFSCTNSIGSSIVMMWSVRDRLTRSTSEHNVVDFPAPPGPGSPRRCGAGDEHQALRQEAELLHLLGDVELVHRDHLRRDH